jgi:hypothetical protein
MMYQVGWVSTKVLVEPLWGKNGILRVSHVKHISSIGSLIPRCNQKTQPIIIITNPKNCANGNKSCENLL